MSNLLQKASIVTTPTAYGVGVLNSIKPAQSFGEELVTNGNFATDSDWNKGVGWTISGGKANANTIGNFVNLYQNSVFVIGRKYKYSFTVANYTQGSIRFTEGGLDISGEKTSTGVYTGTFTASNYTSLYMQGKNSFIGSIDNVSVVEVTDADFDFTRTSSATRVNPDYLIETVSINSANLVQNGNFSELGAEEIINGDFSNGLNNWLYQGDSITIVDGAARINRFTDVTFIRQNVLTSGKTYLVEFDVLDKNDNSGTFTVRLGSNNVYNVSTYEGTRFSKYIVSTGVDFRIYSSTNNGVIYVDNVSVKQVDPNDYWTLTGTATITNNQANINSPSGESAEIYQSSDLIIGKKYKLECNLNKTSGDTQFVNGGTFILNNGFNTIQFIATDTRVYFKRGAGSVISSLTNISVIEIQENGVPRLDYTNGAASILLENQSTNLETKSNGFSTWTLVSNVTRTADYTLSPEGVSNATRLQFTSNGFVANTTITSGTQYTVSVYAKRNDTGTQSFGFFVDGSGAVDSEMSLTSEWKRFSFTRTATNGSYVGLAGLSGADVSVYGFQLETQSFSTSLIPTSGSTVTRAAETLNNAGNSDLINSTEGVLYAEISALADDFTSRKISLNNGSSALQLAISYHTTSNSIRCFIYDGSLKGEIISTDFNILENNKIAYKYKSGSIALWVNGNEVNTSNDTFSINGLNELGFDDGSGSSDFYGKCKTVAVFKEALSDTELACLTSTNNREIFLNYYYRMQYVGANTEALSCAEQTFNV